MFHNGCEQRRHVVTGMVRIKAGVTLQRRGVDDREIELFVGRAEPVEQFKGLVEHPVRP